jgi:hypothetical protein
LKERKAINDLDATLYIKGFFTHNKLPTDFDGWSFSHSKIEQHRGWGSQTFGWEWESGRSIPIPIATISNIALNAYRYGSKLTRFSPAGIAASVVFDVGFNAAYKYWDTTQNAEQHAYLLAAGLVRLYESTPPPGKIRVVAHSLGCKLLVKALEQIPYENRPHEVHLCGAAVSAKHLEGKLTTLAREHTFIYYSTQDYTLKYGYPILNDGQDAVGYSGLLESYPNVSVILVDFAFKEEYLVHRFYPWLFHKFAGLQTSSLLSNQDNQQIQTISVENFPIIDKTQNEKIELQNTQSEPDKPQIQSEPDKNQEKSL